MSEGLAEFCITLFADASFDHRTRIGAWAVWAKYNGETARAGAAFKSLLASSTVAELGAIANGLRVAIKQFDPPAGALFVIQSDNTAALALISGEADQQQMLGKLGDDAMRMHGWIVETISARRLLVKTKHVKGHRGKIDRRSAVNTWCDRICRRYMREARARGAAADARQRDPGDRPLSP